MKCPRCLSEDHSVIETRSIDQGIRRRRECKSCQARWTTYEITHEEHRKLNWIQDQYAKLRSLLEDQL